jgi:hypothetical protein
MKRSAIIFFSLLISLLAPIQVAQAVDQLVPSVPCSETKKAPCIESLKLISDSGKVTEAIPTGPTYKSQYCFAGLCTPEINIYQWKTPGILHENETELLTLQAYQFPLGGRYKDGCGPGCDLTNVDETVIYINASGLNAPNPVIHFPELSSDLVCGVKGSPQLCTRAWSLNNSYKYEVTLRAMSTFDFSHSNGEARDGNLTMKVDLNGDKLLTFSGKPVTFSFNVVSDLKPANPNQLAADISYDYIGVYAHSAQSQQAQWLSKCDYGRGMSLWYSGQLLSMPMWMPEDSALTLQVTSTHLRADRTENAGIFNIVMPINLAKCLWGVDLSKAASASISASYPELGISEIVTTASKVVGDTFQVSAAGFHFSAPVIKMKVTQGANTQSATPESSPTPTAKPSPSAVAAAAIKKSTISCVKGTTTKKVTAVSPKCPAGYKKR